MANPNSSFIVNIAKTVDDSIFPDPSQEYPGISIGGSVFFNANEEEDEETHETILNPQYRITLNHEDLISQAAAAFGVPVSNITVSGDVSKQIIEIYIGTSGPVPK